VPHRERGFGGNYSLAKPLGVPTNKGAVVSYRTSRHTILESAAPPGQTYRMRALAGLLVVSLLAVGVYLFFLKKMPATDEGTAPTQAISLTGVRGDLLQIAQAERGYVALNGHCATLDELLSSNSLAMARSERDGYSYSVECSSGDFTATARHAPAPPNSPIRYPTLAIDQNMQVHEVN